MPRWSSGMLTGNATPLRPWPMPGPAPWRTTAAAAACAEANRGRLALASQRVGWRASETLRPSENSVPRCVQAGTATAVVVWRSHRSQVSSWQVRSGAMPASSTSRLAAACSSGVHRDSSRTGNSIGRMGGFQTEGNAIGTCRPSQGSAVRKGQGWPLVQRQQAPVMDGRAWLGVRNVRRGSCGFDYDCPSGASGGRRRPAFWSVRRAASRWVCDTSSARGALRVACRQRDVQFAYFLIHGWRSPSLACPSCAVAGNERESRA